MASSWIYCLFAATVLLSTASADFFHPGPALGHDGPHGHSPDGPGHHGHGRPPHGPPPPHGPGKIWVPCNYTETPGASCHDCRVRVYCTKLGGWLVPCWIPGHRHCSDGECVREPSEECRPTEPPTEEPSTESPSTESPSSESPSSESPITESPSTESPNTESPSSESPSTQSPSTDEPEGSTEAPATNP